MPGAPGAGPSGAQQAPGGSPTPTPSKKLGLRAGAMTNVSIARNMLEQALTVLDHDDPAYKAVYKALGAINPISAKSDSSDLVPAQVMRMVGELPQMGGGTDVQKMLMQNMRKPPPGGAPPGGVPAGGQMPQPQPGAMQ
jgi:hypothetical protein